MLFFEPPLATQRSSSPFFDICNMFTSQNLYFYTKSINPVCLKGIRCRDIYVPRGTVKKYGPLSSSALKKVQDAPATWSASERDCSSATWESFLPVIFSCLVGALNTVNYAWLQSSVFKLCHKYPSTCLLTPGVVMFLYVWHCMSGGRGGGERGHLHPTDHTYISGTFRRATRATTHTGPMCLCCTIGVQTMSLTSRRDHEKPIKLRVARPPSCPEDTCLARENEKRSTVSRDHRHTHSRHVTNVFLRLIKVKMSYSGGIRVDLNLYICSCQQWL